MLKGLQEMKSELIRARETLLKSAKDALKSEADMILDDSRSNYVPIDHGTLRDDSRVIEAESPTDLSVTIVYGEGPAEAYALAVHENPSSHDPISWQGGVNFKVGGAKYLELPLNAAEHGLAERIGSKLRFK